MTDAVLPAGSWLRRAAPALGAFVGIRVLGVLTLWAWAAASGLQRKMPHVLLSQRWDSLWYSRIASHGYGYSVRTRSGDLHSDLAFFPLLPMLERAGRALTGLSVSDVGLGLSVIASVFAAVGIYAVTEQVTGAGVGGLGRAHRSDGDRPDTTGPRAWMSVPPIAVILWAALPVGVVEWMAYSESLFTALAAWSLYCVVSRRWMWAGLLASAAGLTRPVGVGVVLAVWVGAALAVWEVRTARQRVDGPSGYGPAEGERAEVALTSQERIAWWRLLLGVVIAPLGMLSYVLWVAHRTGHGLAGYLDVQAGWRNGFDGGMTFARSIAAKFDSPVGAASGVGLMLGVALAAWAVVACFRLGRGAGGPAAGTTVETQTHASRTMPWPVITYVVVLVALALGAKGYFGSKPRFFIPIFPLLIPPAAWLARRAVLVRGSGVGAGRVLLGLSALVMASAIFGAFWLNGSGPP